MNIVLGPLTEVLKFVGSRIINQLCYLVHYKRNVDDLRKQMESLEQLNTDVQHSVDAARIRGEEIKVVVEGWLTRVNLLQSKETILQNALKESKGCFPCSLHYQVGKDAKQMIDEVKELLNEGRTINVVSDPSPLPPGLETVGTLDFHVYDSTKKAMEEIMENLMHKDFNMVGVYGLGGVGKTTLMKEVAKILKRENLFHQVVMVTVSQDPVWTKIQGEIAENLGMTLPEEYLSVRARRLLDRLKKEQSILIVLDDLWKPINLQEQIGIPYGNNCKVILTTRQLEVCHQMQTQANVEVTVLSEWDAWFLFKWAAGARIEDDDTLRPVAKQIVGECRGLPLAIVTIGRALCAKDQYVWRDAAIQLKKSGSVPPDIEGMHEKVFSSIKLSYDFLGNDVTKSCLLLCCMFPEDFSISEDDLLPYVVGEGVFVDVDTLMEVRNRLHTQMERLKGSCLLFDDSSLEERRVKMHDVIRDVCIWIASTEGNDFVVKSGRGLTHFSHLDNLRKCKRLSLMKNKITKLPNWLIDCSHLITISLRGNNDLTEIPDGFFQGMVSLKTLDLIETNISSIPSSLSCCTDLRVLRISRYWGGQLALNVSLLGKLKKLEILDIRKSNVEELPEEIGELVNLKSLNLSRNWNLTIAPNTLSRLSLLEELDASSCVVNGVVEEEEEEIIGKARLAEVASLSSLTRLSMWELNAKYLNANITCRWENLTQFKVSFGPDKEPYFELADECSAVTRTLTITESSNHAIAKWVRIYLLERAEQLQLTACRGFKNVLSCGATGLNNLRILFVLECDDMEYLLSTVEDEVPQIAFTSLECFCLRGLQKFKAICHGSLPSRGCFNNLTILIMDSCSALICIIPSDLLAKLSNLEYLLVRNCDEPTEVFNSEGLEIGQATMTKLKRLDLKELPLLKTIWKGVVSPLSLLNLEEIRLDRLYKLKFIFSLDMAQRLQQLKELQIKSCPALVQIISMVEASNDQNTQQLGSSSSTNNRRPSSSSSSSLLLPATPIFGNLRSLEIDYCSSLKHILPMSLAQGLRQLEILNIWGCSNLEEIIVNDDTGKKEAMSNLRRLHIAHCWSLKHILPMSLAQGLPQLQVLHIRHCSNLEEIIVNDDTGKKEAMSKLVFPGLRDLQLKGLENLSMVSKGVLQHDWPSLESLEIKDCPNLKRLPMSLKTATKLKTIAVQKQWFDGLEWDADQIDDKLHLEERVQVSFLDEDLQSSDEFIQLINQILEEDLHSLEEDL